jgi:hypothetical protein
MVEVVVVVTLTEILIATLTANAIPTLVMVLIVRKIGIRTDRTTGTGASAAALSLHEVDDTPLIIEGGEVIQEALPGMAIPDYDGPSTSVAPLVASANAGNPRW